MAAPQQLPPPPKFETLDLADTTVMDFDRLQQFALAISLETDKEMEQIKVYQAERDQLVNYWTITANRCRDALKELTERILELEMYEYSLTETVRRERHSLMAERWNQARDVASLNVDRPSELTDAGCITMKKEKQIWLDLQNLKKSLTEKQLELREVCSKLTFQEFSNVDKIMEDSLKRRNFELQKLAYEDRLRRNQVYNNFVGVHKAEHELKNKIFKKMHSKIWCEQIHYAKDVARMRRYNLDTIMKLKQEAESLVRQDEWQTRYTHRLMAEKAAEIKERLNMYGTAQELRNQLIGGTKAKCREDKIIREKLPWAEYEWCKAHYLNCTVSAGVQNKENEIKLLLKRLFSLHFQLYDNQFNYVAKSTDNQLQKLFDLKVLLFHILNESDPNLAAAQGIEDEQKISFKTEKLETLWKQISNFRLESRAIVTLLKHMEHFAMMQKVVTPSSSQKNLPICYQTRDGYENEGKSSG